MEIAVLAGRILFSLIFIFSGFGHFAGRKMMAGYAKSKGVPASEFMVVASGALALAGGLSVLLGYQARYGAGLLVVFLLPVTFMMHRFWAETDPMQKVHERVNFFKNLSLLGAALIVIYFGSGPYSLGG
jgi:putative oxidoreductase